jgi:hypothetical protein
MCHREHRAPPVRRGPQLGDDEPLGRRVEMRRRLVE